MYTSSGNSLHKFKVIFLGESNVGKTALIGRFLHNNYEMEHELTVAIEFFFKTISVKDEDVRLELWDYGFRRGFILPGFSAAVVVYDITNADSFLNTSAWISDARSVGGKDVVIALVGHKADWTGQRAVRREDGARKAQELGVMFADTSAKSGDNVQALFRRIATALIGEEVNDDNSVNHRTQ